MLGGMASADEGNAFISYVREDAERVDRLQHILESAGVKVWRDSADLWPGEDWRARIREAITRKALAFIACFSESSEQRELSGQNEELVLAVDQLRLRRPDQPWLIPVRFDDVDVPNLDLGGGRTLDSLQRVDLTGEIWDQGAARLVAGVLRILDRADSSASTKSPPVDWSFEARLKTALRDASGDIALSDLLIPLAQGVRTVFLDKQRFPSSSEQLRGASSSAALYVADVVYDYVDAVNPALDAILTTAAWAKDPHLPILTRFVEQTIPPNTDPAGMVVLTALRSFPILCLAYTGALAAMYYGNLPALRAIVVDAHIRDYRDGRIPVLARLHPWRPFSEFELVPQVLALRAAGEHVTTEVVESLKRRERGNRYTPLSDFLHDLLRPKFEATIPADEDYSDLFDRTEILMAVLAVDLKMQVEASSVYVDGGHYGRFTWRDRYSRPEDQLEHRMLRDLNDSAEQWPPIAAGLFGGSVSRAQSAFEHFIGEASEARSRRW